MSQTFARAARQVARYFKTSCWIACEGLRDATDPRLALPEK